MKKLSIVICMLLVATFLIQGEKAAASEFREVKTVNASSLVVKDKASQSGKTIGTLNRGIFVTVFSTTNGWAYIQSGQTKGYVNGAYLAKPKSTIKIASSKSGLVVKETATKSAKTAATLKYNMIVEDFGSVGGGWSFVQYGNVTGYVATSFINTPTTTTKYTTDEVAVRNIASPSGSVLSYIAAGQKVTVHATLAGWSYVSAGSTRGYVQAAKLTVPKTNKTAYAKDYLPNCSKSYVFKSVSDYVGEYDEFSGTDYIYTACEFYSSGRLLADQFDEYGFNSTYYELTSEGYLYHGLYEDGYEYHFPLTQGKTWRNMKYDTYEYYRVVSMNEIVTTKAGTFFNVIKIKVDDEGYHYLAPGAGIIKKEISSDWGTYTYELYDY